jgi:hypothetical protein
MNFMQMCEEPDQSSATVRLHYLKDGNVSFKAHHRRAEYFILLAFLLKAFAGMLFCACVLKIDAYAIHTVAVLLAAPAVCKWQCPCLVRHLCANTVLTCMHVSTLLAMVAYTAVRSEIGTY